MKITEPIEYRKAYAEVAANHKQGTPRLIQQEWTFTTFDGHAAFVRLRWGYLHVAIGLGLRQAETGIQVLGRQIQRGFDPPVKFHRIRKLIESIPDGIPKLPEPRLLSEL